MAGLFGYIVPPAKPKPPLATVMGGSDPFGFQRAKNTSRYRDPLASLTGPTGPHPATPAPPPTVKPVVVPTQAPSTSPVANTTFPRSADGGSVYSIETDPALQQVYAYANRTDSEAQAGALADKTRLVETAGLPDLATALGLGGDVASVARGNSFSTAANLAHARDVQARQLDLSNQQNREDFVNQANQANLLYSGYKNRQLGRLADAFTTAQSENTRSYQQGLADLAAAVQDRIAQINAALGSTLGANDQQRIAAEQAAADRQLQLALAGASTPDVTPKTFGADYAPGFEDPVPGYRRGVTNANLADLLFGLAGY